MIKINNPYTHQKGFNCFACSSENPIGLKMDFFEADEEIISEWKPAVNYSGYQNILHGGIQATLMDEIASWFIQVKLKTGGVTSSFTIKYLHPVYTDQKIITLKARLVQQTHRLVTIGIELLNSDYKLCTTAEAVYYIFPQKIAMEKYGYPDPSEFYKEEGSEF